MPTETATDREKADRLVGTIKAQGPRIAEILAGERSPFAADRGVTDSRTPPQGLLLRALESAREKLVAADRAYYAYPITTWKGGQRPCLPRP